MGVQGFTEHPRGVRAHAMEVKHIGFPQPRQVFETGDSGSEQCPAGRKGQARWQFVDQLTSSLLSFWHELHPMVQNERVPRERDKALSNACCIMTPVGCHSRVPTSQGGVSYPLPA